MASLVRLRALVGFYRPGARGLVLVKPGEVFRVELAEALDLLNWQRCEPADEAEFARFKRAPVVSWSNPKA